MNFIHYNLPSHTKCIKSYRRHIHTMAFRQNKDKHKNSNYNDNKNGNNYKNNK